MDLGQGFMAPLSVGKKQYIFFSLFGVSSGGVPSPGIVEGALLCSSRRAHPDGRGLPCRERLEWLRALKY